MHPPRSARAKHPRDREAWSRQHTITDRDQPRVHTAQIAERGSARTRIAKRSRIPIRRARDRADRDDAEHRRFSAAPHAAITQRRRV
jgi:hypothetical protein